MRSEQHGFGLGGMQDAAQGDGTVFLIQAGEGFVQDQRVGRGKKCARQSQAALHAAGIFADRLAAHIG